MKFEQGSLPLGSVVGIPVRLHVTFPLIFVIALLAQSSYTWLGVGWVALVYGPILLGTVFIHELGHSLAARRLGAQAEGILLWPLGGLAFIGHSNGPRDDLLIALAGPATHIPQFLVWFGVLFPVYHAAFGDYSISLAVPSPKDHFWLAVVTEACWINILLTAFNLLLPAYPLDGGRVLADALLLCGVGVEAAARVTAGFAVVLGVGVLGLGIWQLSVLTIAVGLWMLYSTFGLVQAIREGAVRQHPMFCYEQLPASSQPQVAMGSSKGGYQHYSGDNPV